MIDEETMSQKESLIREAARSVDSTLSVSQIDTMRNEMQQLAGNGEHSYGACDGGEGAAGGPFAPVYDEEGVVVGLEHCYYQAGGKTHLLPDQTIAASTSGYVALKYDATDEQNDGEIEVYSDLPSLQSAQGDPDSVIVPLYLLEDSSIVVDLRAMPHVQVAEVL